MHGLPGTTRKKLKKIKLCMRAKCCGNTNDQGLLQLQLITPCRFEMLGIAIERVEEGKGTKKALSSSCKLTN